MSIVRMVEKPGSRRHRQSKEGNEYEFTLTVFCNSATDNEYTITRTPGVPKWGTPFVRNNIVDASSPCAEINVQQLGRVSYRGTMVWHWEVECKFSPKDLNKKKPDDPLLWPTEIRWSSKTVDKESLFDAEGRPLLNSVDERLRGTPPLQIEHALLSLTRVEMMYNAVLALSFANKVNGNQWFACPPYTAKAKMPEAVNFYEERVNRYFWRVTYNFEIAPEGWLPGRKPELGNPSWIADTGFNYYIGDVTGKNKVAITDKFGHPVTEPQFLDGRGGLLPTNAKQPVMLPYRFFKPANFAALRLP